MRRENGSARLMGTTCAACLVSGAALAEVSTDGTLGRRVRLAGPDVEVGAELGRISGRNLFHSFERFGVGRGGSVTFTGPSGLDNVVSRVTGGGASRIDGTLRSRVPGADVYLVNPAGIVFGPGARLDVPGSFHASTADEVRFPGGARFSALDPGGSTLSVAPPEAFGFLGARPGAITVDRGVLEVPAGERLSLVGGDVTVTAGVPDPAAPAPTVGIVRAQAGTVTLGALGGAGEAAIGGGRITGEATGAVLVAGRALVESTGDGGGSVRIAGGRVRVEGGSFVFADNTGPTDSSGGVTIEAEAVGIVGGSAVTADALGEGDAGAVAVRAGDLQIRGAGFINSNTFGAGDAGVVAVDAGRLLVEGAGTRFATGIASFANPGSGGDAGTVTVTAGDLELREGGRIASDTFGAGDAGEITVVARRLLVDGVFGGFFTGISSGAEPGSPLDPPGSTAAAGRVTVTAGDIHLRDGGQISTRTFTAGDAGEIVVTAGRLLLSGSTLGFNSAILSEAGSSSTANGGRVTVTAGDLELRGDSFFSTRSLNLAAAGDIEVRASRLVLRDSAVISSSGGNTGPAGDVRLVAGALLVDGTGGTDDFRAGVFTLGLNNTGGRIDITARDVAVLRDAEVTSSGIVPAAGASLITLRAPQIALLDGSRVLSLTGDGTPLTGSGEARVLGDLTFISEDSLVDGSSTEELSGVDNQVGTGLQLPPGSFLDAEGLLGASCPGRAPDRASSFTRAPRKGGLPPSPDRPLASTGGAPPSGQALRAGGVLRVASAGCAAGG